MTDNTMSNYGPGDSAWELWHRGPILDRQNVVLVHGYRLPLASKRGRCDKQFARLDDLLQTEKDGYNVWQFEYVASRWGTYDTVAAYSASLSQAIDRISTLTGGTVCSMVAYSMGGLIARQYIAAGGKSKIDKLLTLAVPHMGTLRFEPFSLALADRILPRAAAELRPDGRLLWDLNCSIDSSSTTDFAAIGGNSWGSTDGLVEISSAGLSRCGPDGSILETLYFAGVNRSHLSINRISHKDDEVYRLIRGFLRGGTAGISALRPAEKPGDYRVPYFLTFALKIPPIRRASAPVVFVPNTGRRYSGMRIMSQGARTDDGATIFTVQLNPDDDGEARIHHDQEECATVRIRSGHSALVTQPILSG